MKDLAVAVELPGDADPFWFGFDDVGVPRVVLIREKLGESDWVRKAGIGWSCWCGNSGKLPELHEPPGGIGSAAKRCHRTLGDTWPVSYTHLVLFGGSTMMYFERCRYGHVKRDVYKRQAMCRLAAREGATKRFLFRNPQ
ncbi:hypothetical protein DEO72_LG8g1831 [Vigna unguiculata]|uniref:Uncharacterized protein n=1 Tax=Vigna unguiculata TaxID=3917 RepID=A0A4D6MSP5_VIGUN|nr:hypothetical protein DEO72_LG8g1831 [Vigna unguiculata]